MRLPWAVAGQRPATTVRADGSAGQAALSASMRAKAIRAETYRGRGLRDNVSADALPGVKKGDKLYVEGRIEYRQWQDKDGQTKYSTEINVRELIMLGSPKGGMDGDSSKAKGAGAKAKGGIEALGLGQWFPSSDRRCEGNTAEQSDRGPGKRTGHGDSKWDSNPSQLSLVYA